MAVAVVERFKQEVMYGLSAGTKKVAVVENWPLVEVRLHNHTDFDVYVNLHQFTEQMISKNSATPNTNLWSSQSRGIFDSLGLIQRT